VQEERYWSIPIGDLLWQTREQTGLFNALARLLRSTPSTHRSLAAHLGAPEHEGDAPVDRALISTKIFVCERNKDNGEEREGEDEARRYVPLLEDDAGILYLGIPVM